MRQAINLFLSLADQLYGPITTIRQNNHLVKKIPWSVFRLSDDDWQLVYDTKSILVVGLLVFSLPSPILMPWARGHHLGFPTTPSPLLIREATLTLASVTSTRRAPNCMGKEGRGPTFQTIPPGTS
jgi:hypothetical protein